MRPRRTPSSNFVYRLPGGTEDNDLHCRIGVTPGPHTPAGVPCIVAVFEPDPEERAAIAAGDNVELTILGEAMPPVSITTTREQPTSRAQRTVQGSPLWAELDSDLAGDISAAIDNLVTDLGGDEPERAARLADFRVQLERGLDEVRRRAQEPPS